MVGGIVLAVGRGVSMGKVIGAGLLGIAYCSWTFGRTRN